MISKERLRAMQGLLRAKVDFKGYESTPVETLVASLQAALALTLKEIEYNEGLLSLADVLISGDAFDPQSSH